MPNSKPKQRAMGFEKSKRAVHASCFREGDNRSPRHLSRDYVWEKEASTCGQSRRAALAGSRPVPRGRDGRIQYEASDPELRLALRQIQTLGLRPGDRHLQASLQ